MNSFYCYFESLYQKRWPGLLAALLAPTQKIEQQIFNGFASYRLDLASLRTAQALRVQSEDLVLDLCAAPGGKTLLLLEALQDTGQLTANEISYSRRKRLESVIRDHVPLAQQGRVKVTGYDGNQFGLKKVETYDRILIDAPCSSERHLLEQDPSMKEWKLSRTTQLAKRQYSLLCSALLALKSGGTMVYSTCSISPIENDGVIGRLLERKAETVILDPDHEDLRDFEKTKHGFQMFPDTTQGAGPMYLSRLKKL